MDDRIEKLDSLIDRMMVFQTVCGGGDEDLIEEAIDALAEYLRSLRAARALRPKDL